jgi:GMP synthase (glutamine-hydrolysing)
LLSSYVGGYDEAMKPILILKTGSTFDAMALEFGDFEDWVIAASGEAPGLFSVADGVQEELPPVKQLSGLIITGSHLMVSDGGPLVELWAQLVREAVAARLPVFGICFGHQLLNYALGGEVGYHPRGLELGQVEIEMAAAAADDPLFSVLPARFQAYATHQQSVLRLAPTALVLGGNSFEAHHAVRFASYVWGVQFHPEFTQPILQAYIRVQRAKLTSDARMADLLARVESLPEAGLLIRRFCQLASS